MLSRLRKCETRSENNKSLGQADTGNPPASVLTPTYAEDAVSKQRHNTVSYMVSAEDSAKLPEILAQASPFVSPLTITQLVELVYCRMRRSPKLPARAKAAFMPSGWSKYRDGTSVKQKKTSMRLNVEIIDYLTANFHTNALRAMTHFISWIVSDWDWPRPWITGKGFGR